MKSASSSASPDYDSLLKLVMLGSAGSGKSALLLRFADDNFTDSYISTIGVDFRMRTLTIQGRRVKLQIWDTAGQERFRTITSSYLRGAGGMLLCFDVTSEESFGELNTHYSTIEKHGNPECAIVLCGCKSDLLSSRQVDEARAEAWAASHGMTYMETSAKTSTNVDMVFVQLSETALAKLQGHTTPVRPVVPTPETKAPAKVTPAPLVAPPPPPALASYNVQLACFFAAHYNNPASADVVFSFPEEGSRSFHGHRVIVGGFSSVLDRRIQARTTPTEPVVLTDISPRLFEQILLFMYRGERALSVGGDDLGLLLVIADTYQITALNELVGSRLAAAMAPSNAVSIFMQAPSPQGVRFIANCMHIIIANNTFYDLSKEKLKIILLSDDINILEIELFHAVIKWGETELKRQAKEATKPALKEVLSDVVPLLRLPTIPMADIAKHVSTSGVLEEGQAVQLFTWVASEPTRGLLPMPFPTEYRKGQPKPTTK